MQIPNTVSVANSNVHATEAPPPQALQATELTPPKKTGAGYYLSDVSVTTGSLHRFSLGFIHAPIVNSQMVKRIRLNEEQLGKLEGFFLISSKPCSQAKKALATETQLAEKHVQIWFQNRYDLLSTQPPPNICVGGHAG